ncbi:MAG: C25 family cysteine peptidase, partial [Candidatus Bathyarchaeota archaeon]|nr:C25 family cysteine peptidase [Candidatus Bathyarchaeota archaeon]
MGITEKGGVMFVMRKRVFQVVFLAIVILMSSLTIPLKAMEALGGNICPAGEKEFVDYVSEAPEEENFDVPDSLLFEGMGELAENPYACSLLWKICGVRECDIPSKDTIGTSIIQWNGENSVELNVSTGSFKLVTVEFKDKKWQLILCNNTENLNGYGKPAMPYKKLLIPLNDAEVVDVKVEEECVKEFFKVDILPGFKPLPLGQSYLNGLDTKSYFEKYFYADPSIYQSDRAFPPSTVTYETVVHGSNRILVLEIFPFKFYPTRSKIGVFDIHINIELSKPSFGSMWFSSSLLQEEDPEYVIVTPSAFSSAVESLATWKEELGFSVQITTLEYIYNNFAGRDKAEKLREFIKESYYTNGTEYYLLVGDCDVCPAREVWDPAMGPGLDNGTEPCDLYFECLDGDWDADGDSLFGEMEDDVDFFPEVKVGRLPVNTVQEVATVCGMIRKIEEDPEPGDWIKKFLLLANTAFTYGDCAAALDEEINQKFLAGSFFDAIRLYDVDGSLSSSAVTSAMNQGVGLVDFFDHGAYYTWVGALQTSDVLNLLNGNKTFLAFAMACETAAFDYQQYTTISEAFFKNPNGGAIAYIGATRVAWAGYDCFDGLHHRFWINF